LYISNPQCSFGQRYRNSFKTLRIEDATRRLQKRPIFLTNGRDDRRDGVCISTVGVLHIVWTSLWGKTNEEETVDVMVECETRLYSDLLMLEE